MFFRATLFGTAALILASQASAQIPHATYRLVPRTVYESQIVTKYRPQDEVVVERKPVTTYRTETTTEMKERRYRVAKPVVETSEKIEQYKVRRPVTETNYREEFVDRTRYESETKWEEQRRTVMKPVEETSERVEKRTVMRPVKEYAYKNETYTTYRPKTTKGVQWRDAGGYVNAPQLVPGETGRQRLQWMGRQEYINPVTGLPTSQRAGLYWVPQQGQPTVVNRPQYVSRYVPEEVACTTWEAEEVTRRVPIERTRYEEDVEYRKVPVTTKRMVAEEQFRFVPRTVQKPVTERYSRKVPVTSTKWVEEEVVRRVPQKTYKTVYEERVEKVPVEVRRTIPTKQLMEREKTIRRMVPYKEEVIVPKTVVEKQLIENSCGTPFTYSGRPTGQRIVGQSGFGQSATYGEWRPVVENGASVRGDKEADNAPQLPADFVPPGGRSTEPRPAAETTPDADGTRGSKPQLDLTGLLNL